MKIGQFELIKITETGRHGKGLFKCFCGKEFQCQTYAAKAGVKKSCGCLRHGFTKSINGNQSRPEYNSWQSMIKRCYDRNHEQYKNYGARGIKVCDRWRHSFQNFIKDVEVKPLGEKTTLDRIRVNGNYEPGNCRWATQKQQCRNRRDNRMVTYNGESKCLPEWAEIIGINPQTVRSRFKRGWTVNECFTIKPVNGNNQCLR